MSRHVVPDHRRAHAARLAANCFGAVMATACVLGGCRPQESSAPTAALAEGEARVVVRVLCADGRPIDNAYVGVLALELSGPLRAASMEPDYFVPRGGERVGVNVLDVKRARTNSDGVAEVVLREPLLDFVAYASSGVNVASVGLRHLQRSETVHVEMKLAEGLVAVGRVTDTSGVPRSGVELQLSWVGADTRDVAQGAGRATGKSEPDGSFRLGPIAPRATGGDVELVAFAFGPVRTVLPAWRDESDALTVTVPAAPR